jgi:hypothetical protein
MITLIIDAGIIKPKNTAVKNDIKKKSNAAIITVKDNLGKMFFKKSPPVQYNVFYFLDFWAEII